MSISFACPQCQNPIKAADEHAGRKVRCPKCSAGILVPAATAAAPPVASPPAAQHDDHHEHDFDDHDDDEHDEDHEDHGLMGPKDKPHEDLIDMTPMVDIVFFLLIFFLTTSMAALQAVMNLPNPQKATDKGGGRSVTEASPDSDTLKVTIQDDDTFWIDDEQCFSDQDLRMKIQAAVADAGGKPLTLVVIAAADASHGAAIRVFDAGAAARVGNISLLVREDLEK
ncbi:ExbD/TolR family protein [Anatilimnocola floriformis]|uniref:ExbD/TolR family protein n=1 Tax=Anatilimnocola floriformis TaxID=2948575 RepID=UPI0020C24EFD|nr:biopolymer transporter ExbD [Anatilimnocola floriformis]